MSPYVKMSDASVREGDSQMTDGDPKISLDVASIFLNRIEPEVRALQLLSDPTSQRLDLSLLIFLATNMTYCCSVYMKTALLLNGRQTSRSYDVRKLFNMLPQAAKKIIEDNYIRYFPLIPDARAPRVLQIGVGAGATRPLNQEDISLRRLLKETGGTFQEWRYLSITKMNPDRPLIFHHFGLRVLCNVLDGIARSTFESRGVPLSKAMLPWSFDLTTD
jgi:hypothetical protein